MLISRIKQTTVSLIISILLCLSSAHAGLILKEIKDNREYEKQLEVLDAQAYVEPPIEVAVEPERVIEEPIVVHIEKDDLILSSQDNDPAPTNRWDVWGNNSASTNSVHNGYIRPPQPEKLNYGNFERNLNRSMNMRRFTKAH